MKLITQYLPESQLKSLEKISKKTGIKRAELIRRAVEEFLKKEL